MSPLCGPQLGGGFDSPCIECHLRRRRWILLSRLAVSDLSLLGGVGSRAGSTILVIWKRNSVRYDARTADRLGNN